MGKKKPNKANMQAIEVGPDIKLSWRDVQREWIRRQKKSYKIDCEVLKKLPLAEKKNLALLEIGLSIRTANGLDKRFQALFVGKLLQIEPAHVKEQKNFGKKTIAEIYNCLDAIGVVELWISEEELLKLIAD